MTTTGILIENSSEIELRDNKFIGVDTAIKASSSSNISISNNSIESGDLNSTYAKNDSYVEYFFKQITEGFIMPTMILVVGTVVAAIIFKYIYRRWRIKLWK